jgi:hypothetical protein
MTLEGNILFFFALSRGFYHYIRSHANGKGGIMILGTDVGGIHTDAVLIEGCTVTKKAKVLTNEKILLASLLAVTTKAE